MANVDDAARARLEEEVRELCAREDIARAATRAVQGYGPQLYSFLVATCRDESEASEAFSETTERIWKGLATFAWESTLRTWAYVIARNVVRNRRRNAARKERRAHRTGESALEDVAHAVRTQTQAFLRTETKTRLQALRDSLSEEDRALLILRVDRQLGWNDLARVFAGDEAALSDADVAKEAARLRMRYQLVKDRLRELAKKEGLVE